MRSITYWNRLEPRPRSTDIAPALAARVRDPLWMLTRQWQFGEFQGEDAGSPAYVQMSATEGRVLGWQDQSGAFRAVAQGHPLEPAIVHEDFSPDLASRVETGQLFEQLLAALHVPELVHDFRTAYPLAPLSDAEFAATPDRDSARFRQLAAGRVVDGLAVYAAARAAAPALPPQPAVDPSKVEAVRNALTQVDAWIRDVWGGFSSQDSGNWRPDRLEYGVSLVAASPGGGASALAATPGSTASFEWQTLETAAAAPAGVAVPADAVHTTGRTIVPGRVAFRGMPNHRWWDFESGQVDFGGVRPDQRDVTKLIFIDFMLVHGNDWFLVPLEQTAGSLSRVDALVVHDVFGSATQIVRADANATTVDQRWTMFSMPAQNAPGSLSDAFVLPPGPGPLAERGRTIEEVLFLRDDMADMAWAVEVTTENALGNPWSGYDRDLATHANDPAPVGASGPDAPLRYQIQTRVPDNWIPLLPVVVDPAQGDIAFERGAMLTDAPSPTPILPAGRVLNPSSLKSGPYRIREEEIPREGLRVKREVLRARGTDGSTYVWIARRKQIGRGEGSSGLRFDLASHT
jgi:hypothetical protein